MQAEYFGADLHTIELMICALCQQDRILRRSHIIPEFVHAPLYNDRNQMSAITGVGKQGRRIIQQGVREPLLCERCEQLINERYEKPFRTLWFDQSPLPPHVEYDGRNIGIDITGISYSAFKLFHLSILFRASVARDTSFAEVRLGPHEHKLRQMLLDGNPGEPHTYPILAVVVVDRQHAPVDGLITYPRPMRYDGRTVYEVIFGGCAWYYTVSSHRSRDLEAISLKPSGVLHLGAERWENIQGVKEARRALKR
jgi:hypothetical protein